MTDGQHCAGCRGWTLDWELDCPGLGSLEDVLQQYARDSFGQETPPVHWKLIEALAETIRRREINPGLRWCERREDGYWQEWYCEPPRRGLLYRVGREYWEDEDGQPVRRIYEIRVVTDEPQAEGAGT